MDHLIIGEGKRARIWGCSQNHEGRWPQAMAGKKMWCVPEIDEEYKRRMFDVLDTYERPYDPLLPVVCLDEKLVELS